MFVGETLKVLRASRHAPNAAATRSFSFRHAAKAQLERRENVFGLYRRYRVMPHASSVPRARAASPPARVVRARVREREVLRGTQSRASAAAVLSMARMV